jgi:serine/threonine protein phosphatase PrpC
MRVNTTAYSKSFIVVALVDGMGGMQNGSKCATHTLSSFFNAIIRFRQKSPNERLELAANIANMAVYEFSKGGGGATLSALLVSVDQDACVLNVGDSRIYATLAEDEAKKIIRLTVDDSLEEAVGGHGKELLQFVGMGEGLRPHITVVPQNAKRILITSDGIHFIHHETLCEALLYTQGLTQVSEQLLSLARWRGAPDNASLAITNLQELTQSLTINEETGVEIWDSFSALHIMWLKQEYVDFPALTDSPKVSASADDLYIKNTHHPKNPSDKVKPPNKSRKPKKDKKKLAAQLTFEINSEVNKGNDK